MTRKPAAIDVDALIDQAQQPCTASRCAGGHAGGQRDQGAQRGVGQRTDGARGGHAVEQRPADPRAVRGSVM